jgi:hypothetical protein
MSEDAADVFENAQLLKDFIEANLSISFSIEDDNPKKFTLEKINPRAVFAICSVLLKSKDRLERLESERAKCCSLLERAIEDRPNMKWTFGTDLFDEIEAMIAKIKE